MDTLRFKTKIYGGSCVATVTPCLNQENSSEKWQVDTNNPDKILNVAGSAVNEKDIIEAIEKVGFTIEPLG